jgi:hypothetical protein
MRQWGDARHSLTRFANLLFTSRLAMAPRRETCFLTHTIARSAWLGFAATTAFALTLSTERSGVAAQETKARPLPLGVAACDFKALANDHTPAGLNIRADSRADSAICR